MTTKRRHNNIVLSDVGEFGLLKKIVFPTLTNSINSIGNDCAILKLNRATTEIVITTDAGPKPIIYNNKHSYYYMWGWYTVLANVSDLASSGAYPIGLSLSVEAKSNMPVNDFIEYFKGVNDASIKFEIPITGGNIKENTKFVSSATAIGYLKKGQKLITRSMARPGDLLISIGENGRYISAYLKHSKLGEKGLTKDEKKRLFSPSIMLKEMQILNNGLRISAATDNSDGLLGAIWNIAERSGYGFEIDMNNVTVSQYVMECSKWYKCNPLNIFFFWGDWQTVLTLQKSEISKFKNICAKYHIPYTILGAVINTKPKISFLMNGERKNVKVIRNENFNTNSYNKNPFTHINHLLKMNLF
jgi:thiamine-monophosphate kinase